MKEPPATNAVDPSAQPRESGLRAFTYPIPLNAEQEQAAKDWAADDRLWTTQETVEFNLRTFARKILALASLREPPQAPPAFRDVLNALVEKLDVIIPIVDGYIALSHIRSGSQYSGPNLVEELANAKALLAGDVVPAKEESLLETVKQLQAVDGEWKRRPDPLGELQRIRNGEPPQAPPIIADDELLTIWRAVQGPHAGLTGPLIRFAGQVAALVCARSASDKNWLRAQRDVAEERLASLTAEQFYDQPCAVCQIKRGGHAGQNHEFSATVALPTPPASAPAPQQTTNDDDLTRVDGVPEGEHGDLPRRTTR